MLVLRQYSIKEYTLSGVGNGWHTCHAKALCGMKSENATFRSLRNLAWRYRVYSDMRIAVPSISMMALSVCMFGQQNPVSRPETGCSSVVLLFRCLRQPPIFHRGEIIQARLSLATSGPPGFTALPDTRRGFFHEIMIWEPEKDAVDPSTLDPRIRVGNTLGSGWSEERNREIDVNEWVQFRRPGRYALQASLKHTIPAGGMEKNGKPYFSCEIKSTPESIEILSPDAQWEAAELTRIGRLLESDTTRFAGASSLRYLNTPEAGVALAHWYLWLVGEPVNSELANGIFESQYADIEQSELERALRSGVRFTENAVRTLALLEVKRQFTNRPRPSDPKAASVWSQEYWALFETMKAKYSAAAHAMR